MCVDVAGTGKQWLCDHMRSGVATIMENLQTKPQQAISETSLLGKMNGNCWVREEKNS